MEEGWIDPLQGQQRTVQIRPPTQREVVLAAQQRAWDLLLADFRALIRCGKVVLQGLQIAPSLAHAPTEIPAIWAPLLRFVVAQNVVTAQDAKFMEVVASRSKPKAATLPTQVAPAAGWSDDVPDTAKRGQGRENYTPLIKEALQARWCDVEARTKIDGKFVSTIVADMVLNWLKEKYPVRFETEHLPAFETIRTRLPMIYRNMLNGKAVQ